MVYLHLLFLIIVANGMPIIGRLVMQGRGDLPIDRGVIFFDGRPLLGTSKTYRGIIFSIIGTVLAALLLGRPWEIGGIVGGLAMVGDCLSSFMKRRLGLSSGAQALGLDQIPESLFPLLGLWSVLSLSATGIVLSVIAFFVMELVFSIILYKLHIRKHPY